MRKLIFLLLLLVTAFPYSSIAMERFDIVTTEEMRIMLLEREQGNIDFLLVNALDELLFNNESIPGSINIPWANVDKTIDRLGTDKNRPIIVYCKGYR